MAHDFPAGKQAERAWHRQWVSDLVGRSLLLPLPLLLLLGDGGDGVEIL